MKKAPKVGETVIYRGQSYFVQDAPTSGRIQIYSGERGSLRVWRSQVRRI